MTRKEAIEYANRVIGLGLNDETQAFCEMAIKALEQEPCKMTVDEYRQRMIQAFQNTNCDELIALCVLPTEKEFEHLKWLLKTHYKKEPCEDAISREFLLRDLLLKAQGEKDVSIKWLEGYINSLPSVTPQEQKTGHCKDCKWWKDSDGVYRRGVGAESQCPINRKEVFEGNGYCYMFETQENEVDNGKDK